MFNLINLIKAVGAFGVAGLAFAESGLLIGFFLPGDSLLFTAGFLASAGYLNIWLLLILTFIGAVAGDSTGYALGRKLGPKVFTKPNSLIFQSDNVIRAEKFFAKYGGKAVLLARFLPVVRTFVPVLAGVGRMDYRHFLIYNLVGGALWSLGLTLAGYFLGRTVPNIDHYLLPIIALIIVLSVLPSLIQLWRHEPTRQRLLKSLKLKR